MDILAAELAAQELVPLSLLLDLGRKSLRKHFSQQAGFSQAHLKTVFLALVRTTCSHVVTDEYLTAASHALYVFIQSTLTSSVDEVREFTYPQAVWTPMWSAVHRLFSENKAKPALQLMDAMTQIVKDSPLSSPPLVCLRTAFSEMVGILLKGQPESQLKETCVIVTFILRKLPGHVLLSDYLVDSDASMFKSMQLRCRKLGIDMRRFHGISEQPIRLLLLALLLIARLKESRTAALKLFSYLCYKDGVHGYTANISNASQVIQTYLEVNAESLTEFSAILFPAVLVDETQFRLFTRYHNPSVGNFNHALEIYLALFQVGRDKGFLSEEDLCEELSKALLAGPTTVMAKDQPYRVFDMLLSSLDPQIRLRAVKLLITSTSTSSPISAEILACFYRNLANIHNDCDPYYRDEFISYLRRFLQRIERSGHASQTANSMAKHDILPSTLALRYHTYLEQYLAYLAAELGPHLSHARHILALRSLENLVKLDSAGTFPAHWPILLESQVRTLLCLLLDPFEDVRTTSSSILQQIGLRFPACSKILSSSTLVQPTRSLSACTNRADHADALGRLYLLNGIAHLHEDQERLPSSSRVGSIEVLNLLLVDTDAYLSSLSSLSPGDGFPVHGNLLGIAYYVDTCNGIEPGVASQVFKICSKVWNLVYQELCTDTPERTTEIENIDKQIGPKDLLAYSWRALRDSSIVAQATIRKVPTESDFQLHDLFGSLCLAQLIHLRHRGAFSAVAQTFATCCDIVRTAGLIHRQAAEILSKWQHEAFSELDIQGSRLTRRSAGLPAIFSGLLAARDSRQSLPMIDRLITVASEQPENNMPTIEVGELKLPQVHALNCLKDIMMNSKFRLISESMVGRMLGLATQSMGSNIWAIRNCGLMLLRACINRLVIETPEHRDDPRSNQLMGDHEETYMIATKLLKDARGGLMSHGYDISRHSEHIFAALDLLGRLKLSAPSKSFMNPWFEHEMSNAIWAIREYAAALRASTVDFGDEVSSIQVVLSADDAQMTWNSVHGKLFCVRLILSQILNGIIDEEDTQRMRAIVKLLDSFKQTHLLFYENPSVVASHLDIINDIYSIFSEHPTVCGILDQSLLSLTGGIKTEALRHLTPTLRRALVLSSLFQGLRNRPKNSMTGGHITAIEKIGMGQGLLLLEDTDAVLYALEAIETSSIPALRSIDLYLWLVRNATSDDVRAESMLALANNIQCSLNPLSSSDLQLLSEAIKLDRSCSRRLLDAEITLGASIAEYSFSQDELQHTMLFLPKLLSSLQDCVIDEIETSSRLNAAYSLGALCSLIPRESNSVKVLPLEHQLKTALMLYDLLNDDDEEIRTVIAGYTHSLTQRINPRSDSTIASCAIAARKGLLALIQDLYGNSAGFLMNAVGRVLGIKPVVAINETQNLLLYIRCSPVEDLIEKAIHRATDLFAEEDQNLYIDALSEVQMWSGFVDMDQVIAIDGTIVPRLLGWTEEGLAKLRILVSEQHPPKLIEHDRVAMGLGGALGATFNKDILVLSVRVVTVAGMLLRLTQGYDIEAKGKVTALHRRLSEFRHACRVVGAHETLMSTLRSVVLEREVLTTASLTTGLVTSAP